METPGQVRGDELEERLIDFAVRIVKLTAALPKTSAGNHMAGQILRSGTSPAPNYGEARGAESPADFLHKIRVVLKELNETKIWLKIIKKSNLVAPDKMESLLNESTQLCRIFYRIRQNRENTNEVKFRAFKSLSASCCHSGN